MSWTPILDAVVIREYPDCECRHALAAKLGVTDNQLRKRAERLGVRRSAHAIAKVRSKASKSMHESNRKRREARARMEEEKAARWANEITKRIVPAPAEADDVRKAISAQPDFASVWNKLSTAST